MCYQSFVFMLPILYYYTCLLYSLLCLPSLQYLFFGEMIWVCFLYFFCHFATNTSTKNNNKTISLSLSCFVKVYFLTRFFQSWSLIVNYGVLLPRNSCTSWQYAIVYSAMWCFLRKNKKGKRETVLRMDFYIFMQDLYYHTCQGDVISSQW